MVTGQAPSHSGADEYPMIRHSELVETTSIIQERRKDTKGSTPRAKQIKQRVQGTGRCLISTYGTVAVCEVCVGD